MRKSVRVLAALIAVLSLLSLTSLLTASASSADADDVRFKEKIVSVLYDNSGSMNDAPDTDRILRAQYGLGMLAALLSPHDTLVVTPMNRIKANGTSDGTSTLADGVVVDLAASDRNSVVNNLIKQPVFGAFGETPGDSIDVAYQQLITRGYHENSNAVNSNKEYWFVIMTDGAFQGLDSLENTLASYVKANPSMNIVYMGMGQDGVGAVDLNNSDLVKEMNFSAYYANDSKEICSVMREIGNRLSGRYTLPSDAIQVNGKTVTVDLSKCGFSVRSVSVTAQESVTAANKNDPDINLLSAKRSGGSLSWEQGCSIKTDISRGFSAIIEGSPIFEGGTVTLEFSKNIDPQEFSATVEPALSVKAIPLAQIDGSWQSVDTQYISDKMNAEDKIRVTYEVFEEGSGRKLNLEELFGECTATVSANGVAYAPGEDIPLKIGSNTIKMMVSVLNGAYTVPAYLYCYLEEDPTHYRVDSALENNVGGSATANNSLFTVYVNNKAVKKDELSQFKTMTATLEYGGESEEIEYTVLDDGRISVPFDMADKAYGTYKITFAVTSEYDVTRSASTSFANYPQSVMLTVDGNNHLEMTHHAFKSNTEGFSFLLTADGKDFVFNNGITNYTVTYNGQDVTADCTVEGNRLTFVPTFEKTVFGTIGANGVTEDVAVSITSSVKPALVANAKATITILPTVYEVVPVQGSAGEIDRLHLSENEVSTYFAVKRDGEYFTAEELQAALDSGELTLSSKYYDKAILPFSSKVTVESIDGVPVARYCVKEGHPGFFRYLFTTFFTKKGEHPVSAVYSTQGISENAGGNSTVAIAPLGAGGVLSYIWRVILIILLIWAVHVVIVVITVFRISPRHPRGRFISIEVGFDGSESPDVKYSAVNIKAKSRFIPRRLLFNLWAKQSDKGNGYMTIRVVSKNASQFCVSANNECIVFESDDDIGSDDNSVEKLNAFIEEVASGRSPRVIESLTNKDLAKMFPHSRKVFEDEDASSNVLPRDVWRTMNRSGRSAYLAFYDGSELLRVVCFVPLSRQ